MRLLGGDKVKDFRGRKYWYDLTYRKKGRNIIVSTVMEEVGLLEVGDLYSWLPANDRVREAHSGEDNYVPVVFGGDCAVKAQLDWSRPSVDIP